MKKGIAIFRQFMLICALGGLGSATAFARNVEPSFLGQTFEQGSSSVIETVTASSGNPAPAIDRDLTTSWVSNPDEQAWIAVQLEEPEPVRAVYMLWTSALPEEGKVQVSADAKQWQDVGAFDNGFPDMPLYVPCDPVVVARYVRVVCLKRYTKQWHGGDHYKLRELLVNPLLEPFMEEYAEPVAVTFPDAKALLQANSMLARMSLEQKLGYLIGNRQGGFSTKPIAALGLSALKMSDASMGLKQPPNTAFPATILLAATWNTDLAALQGKTIGQEARHNGIGMLLGPGLNIYRDSRNGRNFEYFGEDPFLTSRMGVAYIRAVQAEGVLATAKHYTCNNIETQKLLSNVEVSQRALREIYFPAFRAAVQEADVKAVMTAYNLVNGQYCAENPWLIKDVLEGEWGFNGIVISDWFSTLDPVMGFNAGLCLEMPHERAWGAPGLTALLEDGVIREDELDDKVRRILYAGYSMGALGRAKEDSAYQAGTPEHAARAQGIAQEGIVLLRNEQGVLPLNAQTLKQVILVGPMVAQLPPSATGSGEVWYPKGVSPVSIREAFETRLGTDRVVACETPEDFAALSPGQLAAADAIMACVGFNQKGWGKTVEEGEIRDRPFALTDEQNALILKCAQANPRTVVALTAGGGLDMTGWNDAVAAILHTWYTGSAGGVPLAQVVLGEVNPSGKLPITLERDWEDSPAAVDAPGREAHFMGGWRLVGLPYAEGVFVGYRWYDSKGIPVLYPFGHGLSYTTFSIRNLKVQVEGESESLTVAVSAEVKNTGARAGQEVVQVYVHPIAPGVPRPVRELKGFAKVDLQAGESRTVSIPLNERAFMFFDPEAQEWVLEPGEYEIQVGNSSAELPLRASISL